MKQHTREFMQLIENGKDPGKAAAIAMDILSRCVAGESMGSITVSYRTSLQEDKA